MDLIARLEASKTKTLPYFDLDQDLLERRYGPGKWTVRYILHHLADAETVLYDRIRRVISNPGQVIWAFDQDAWARELGYTDVPLEVSKQIYASVREGVIYCVRTHLEARGHHTFVHSETGIRTLREEMEKVAWHNEHHLAQIEQALQSGNANQAASLTSPHGASSPGTGFF